MKKDRHGPQFCGCGNDVFEKLCTTVHGQVLLPTAVLLIFYGR